MYQVKQTSRFRKDYKLAYKRGYDLGLLEDAIRQLALGMPLPAKYRDPPLRGDWLNHRECHITTDWLLIYKIEENILVLTLTNTGTHADIFGI